MPQPHVVAQVVPVVDQLLCASLDQRRRVQWGRLIGQVGAIVRCSLGDNVVMCKSVSVCTTAHQIELDVIQRLALCDVAVVCCCQKSRS